MLNSVTKSVTLGSIDEGKTIREGACKCGNEGS